MTDDNPFLIYLSEAEDDVVVVQTTVGLTPASDDSLYGGFNLGTHVNDDAFVVHHYRSQLLAMLQTTYPHLTRIQWLNQVHGDTVHHVTDALVIAPIDADAQITTNNDTALAIMTADCVPVMIKAGLANGETLIGAIHAGWQGIAKGIIAKTIQKMLHQLTMSNQDMPASELAELTKDWQAWIGACIGQDSYEVDKRVKCNVMASLAVDKTTENRLFYENLSKPGHYFADLALAAELQVKQCGIKHIIQSGLNSHTDARFYSYRRQTQQGLPATGRMATLIFCANP